MKQFRAFIGGIQTDAYAGYRFFSKRHPENRMLKDKRIHFGKMMSIALNYMLNGWEKLLNYRHDGITSRMFFVN